MKSDKLKGKLTEKSLSYEKCSDSLDISIATFCKKINGKTAFTLPEAEKLGCILNLSDAEKIDIFLS